MINHPSYGGSPAQVYRFGWYWSSGDRWRSSHQSTAKEIVSGWSRHVSRWESESERLPFHQQLHFNAFFNQIPSKASLQLNWCAVGRDHEALSLLLFLHPTHWITAAGQSLNYPEQTCNDLLFFANLWCYLSFILHLKACSILSFSSLGGLYKRVCVCVCS